MLPYRETRLSLVFYAYAKLSTYRKRVRKELSTHFVIFFPLDRVPIFDGQGLRNFAGHTNPKLTGVPPPTPTPRRGVKMY